MVHVRMQGGWIAAAGACLALAGCDPGAGTDLGPAGPFTQRENPQCLALPLSLNATQVRKDGIPALSNPTFVATGHPDAAYARDDTRVVGVVVGGEPLAIPLNILWWHEIVNVSRGSEHVAVSYCPLTGSSLTFDRRAVGGQELRVSGLLYDNNLVMFDQASNESLWAQMLGQAICGPARGRSLPVVRSLETSLGEWRAMHPDTRVASERTGHERNYRVNPYEDFWRLDAPPLFGDRLPDPRRPPKELVLGIPGGESGGLAVPFLDLDPAGRRALHVRVDEAELVVFWHGASRTAVAYFAHPQWPAGFAGPVDRPTFVADGAGYVDRETGTRWNLEGVAVAGPGAGARLTAHPRAFVAFWFAWAVLRPGLELYRAP